jgi:hypothetical protein
MSRLWPLVLTTLAALPVAAACRAAPCVSESFETPLPGAAGVLVRHADVPTARFPGLWQEGEIGAFGYRLYADLSATLVPVAVAEGLTEALTETWQIEMSCGDGGDSCTQVTTGTPPDAAQGVADMLARCLRGEPLTTSTPMPDIPDPAPDLTGAPTLPSTVAVPSAAPSVSQAVTPSETAAPASIDAAPDAPTSDTAAPVVAPAVEGSTAISADTSAGSVETGGPVPTIAEEAPALAAEPAEVFPDRSAQLGPSLQPPLACGVAGLPPAAPVLTLQRLLVMAGEDPGPLDGLMGRRTRAAVIALLGWQARRLPVDVAILAVEQHLCGG